MTDWSAAVLAFWFDLAPERHWRPDPALDAEIRQRFGPLWEEQRSAALERFLGSADSALAAIILFDQFPRNMFRSDSRAYATDALARRIADAAVNRSFDAQVPVERRLFFYLPFEHSEDLADQERAVRLIGALGNAEWTDYAVKHRAVIARFGRFPHRNAAIGRESTEEEKAFGLEPAW